MNACKGSGRAPLELTRVNGALWGRCRDCSQWRPVTITGSVKFHPVIAGLKADKS